MSLNIINETDIKELSKTLLDLIKTEESKQLKDMKSYLNKTNLSAEQKIKEYSGFSVSLFNAKVQATLQTAQQYIISDKQLGQSKLVNEAQISLTEKQIEVAEQERLMAIERTTLTQKQTTQVETETKATTTKTYLAIAETKTKLDNTVASTMSECRKSGAAITSQERTWTDPTTGIVIGYQHLSLAAASSTDTTQGLIGLQMLQLQNQADTFRDHTKVQVANQIMQLSSTAIADGLTSISGLLTSHKQLCVDLVGDNVFTSDYISIS
jgi:hypothetical protein